MNTGIFTFSICFIAILNCYAQVLPQAGARLNYTQVMFEYEKVKGAITYQVQLTEDTPGLSFDHCLLEQTDSSTATLISNLEFGKKYLWRYAGIIPERKPVWKGPYHFEIVTAHIPDKNLLSITVTKNDTTANAGGFIVNDLTHTIIDRTGKMVWYLPNVNWHFIPADFFQARESGEVMPVAIAKLLSSFRSPQMALRNSDFRAALKAKKSVEERPLIIDLRLTPFGTITCMEDSFPAEYDLNGNKLWKAPDNGRVSGDTSEHYNHDFQRLPNGHYMVLGEEIWRKLPGYTDTTAIKRKYAVIKAFAGTVYAKVELGTVIEYDEKGEIVWSWNSQNYFDSNALKPPIWNPGSNYSLKPHVNAFSVDRKDEFVYVGFRDVSRIIKIEKKTGMVVNSWGLRSAANNTRYVLPFHKQHDANILDDGTIAVFNNNDYPGKDSLPDVIVFSQEPTDSGNIIWKFRCDLDSMARSAPRNGGNVEQLKNGNLLVCMGNMSRIFEVTKDKRIVWQAIITTNEKKDTNYFYRLYRAHYLSSLYPCYFTFQTNEDAVSEKSAEFNIRIFNKGSEKDAYHVKILSTSGEILKQFTTAMLDPNRSATYSLERVKKSGRKDKVQIIINSQTNPQLERESWVTAGI